MISMTGYGHRTLQNEKFSIQVELRCYNNRYQDLQINLPSLLSPLEGRVREYVASRFRRGKIDCSVRFREYNAPVRVLVNREAARAYLKAAGEIKGELNVPDEIGLPELMGLEGVLELERIQELERFQESLDEALRDACDQAAAEKLLEGTLTQEDILEKLSRIEEQTALVSSLAPELEGILKESIEKRFKELLGDYGIDEGRVLTETAALLIKYSISEELSRLKAHLQEFRAETERNPSPGKKLDFLCQEINREINTIGSKTPQLEVSRAVVSMKDALEDIREQLRNVE